MSNLVPSSGSGPISMLTKREERFAGRELARLELSAELGLARIEQQAQIESAKAHAVGCDRPAGHASGGHGLADGGPARCCLPSGGDPPAGHRRHDSSVHRSGGGGLGSDHRPMNWLEAFLCALGLVVFLGLVIIGFAVAFVPSVSREIERQRVEREAQEASRSASTSRPPGPSGGQMLEAAREAERVRDGRK